MDAYWLGLRVKFNGEPPENTRKILSMLKGVLEVSYDQLGYALVTFEDQEVRDGECYVSVVTSLPGVQRVEPVIGVLGVGEDSDYALFDRASARVEGQIREILDETCFKHFDQTPDAIRYAIIDRVTRNHYHGMLIMALSEARHRLVDTRPAD